jgi:prolyl oligopeptidase
LHARKMAALMQASTGSDRPILLKYDTKSGHSNSRGKPVNQQIEDDADWISFLWAEVATDAHGSYK